MRVKQIGTIVTVVIALLIGAGSAWADATVTVTREQNKPQSVEVKVGEQVRWVNGSGGTAHITFADGVKFYVGKEGRVTFDKPGTYDYTVHVTGTKVHQHAGTVVVK
jgi:plastocyanin